MFSKILSRNFSTSPLNLVNVVVCGANNEIGKPMSLLLKNSSVVSKLTLFDTDQTPAKDLSQIATRAQVKGVTDAGKLNDVFKDAQLVVIASGKPKKADMDSSEHFKVNAKAIKGILKPFAKSKSKAILAIVTEPVGKLVPFTAEYLKKEGCYDPKKVFGVTALNSLRAKTFVAKAKGLCPSDIKVPVIGGSSKNTIIPVLSQTKPEVKFSQKEVCSMTSKIQNAGSEMAKSKDGGSGMATAFAASQFILNVCKAIEGEEEDPIMVTAFVESDLIDAGFFASKVRLGKNGIDKSLGYGKLSCFEEGLLKEACAELTKEVKAAKEFAACEGK